VSVGLPFEVSWSRESLDSARSLLVQARAVGWANDLARILQDINGRLKHQPLDFGEVYRSRGVVHEHLAVYRGISINFAIDTQNHFVLVRSCRPLSNFGR